MYVPPQPPADTLGKWCCPGIPLPSEQSSFHGRPVHIWWEPGRITVRHTIGQCSQDQRPLPPPPPPCTCCTASWMVKEKGSGLESEYSTYVLWVMKYWRRDTLGLQSELMLQASTKQFCPTVLLLCLTLPNSLSSLHSEAVIGLMDGNILTLRSPGYPQVSCIPK